MMVAQMCSSSSPDIIVDQISLHVTQISCNKMMIFVMTNNKVSWELMHCFSKDLVSNIGNDYSKPACVL